MQGGSEPEEVLEVGINGLVAGNVGDMRQWLALQGFLSALLPAVGAPAFRRWAHTFILQMVGHLRAHHRHFDSAASSLANRTIHKV